MGVRGASDLRRRQEESGLNDYANIFISSLRYRHVGGSFPFARTEGRIPVMCKLGGTSQMATDPRIALEELLHMAIPLARVLADQDRYDPEEARKAYLLVRP